MRTVEGSNFFDEYFISHAVRIIRGMERRSLASIRHLSFSNRADGHFQRSGLLADWHIHYLELTTCQHP